MINTKEIRAAAESVKSWANCNKAWLSTDEDEPAAQVGAVCEDGVRYPVATVDCDQYMHGEDSLPLAKFYATANPETVIALCNEIERLTACLKNANDQAEHFEREWYLLGDRLEAAEKALAEPAVEPVMWAWQRDDGSWYDASATHHSRGMKPLYASPPPAEPAVEPVKFLANGTRFKMSFFQNEDWEGNATAGTHVTCFEAFEDALDGRWVALVAAEDDCHRKLIAPSTAQLVVQHLPADDTEGGAL